MSSTHARPLSNEGTRKAMRKEPMTARHSPMSQKNSGGLSA